MALEKNHSRKNRSELAKIGWKEVVQLPLLGLPGMLAKVDTGAKTSSLHTFDLKLGRKKNKSWLRFAVHPLQRQTDEVVWCEAPVVDYRRVIDSGGHAEMRYVIRTLLLIGELKWEIELTLANRQSMLFRMLIGREALSHRCVVDPGLAFAFGRKPFSTDSKGKSTVEKPS